jgi:hypothetical protein
MPLPKNSAWFVPTTEVFDGKETLQGSGRRVLATDSTERSHAQISGLG